MARIQSYDPRTVFVESERWAEQDLETLRETRCPQYLWRCFDQSPLAKNVAFALPFRQMLANHLFADAGDDLRLFKGITFTYGHNIEIGDNTVVHDDVHLDDRGKLTIGDRVSISDSAHVYSHDHDVVDQTAVTNFHTVVDDDARVTYDSMISAGCRVGKNAVVGAKATVQGDVPDHHIAVGSPARSIRVKPGWESVADPVEDKLTNRADERQIEFDLPDDLDAFDEFGRDLTPPDGVDAPEADG